MPYTLMKGWVWVLLGVLLGIVIGWLLRSIAAKRQVARARKHHVDTVELERLRGRVANLEPVVVERDRLLVELGECRAQVRPPDPVGETSSSPPIVEAADDAAADDAARTEPIERSSNADAPASPPAAPDMSQARAVLGTSIDVDDLRAIEGIGPKIESLCHGIGIRTWFDLSTTEVSLLRTMLADAGSRFSAHDPSTWPEQAGLLAAGRWHDFKELTDRSSGGRATD